MKDSNLLTIILIGLFITALFFVIAFCLPGCNEQEQQLIEKHIPNYEDIKISKIKIVKDGKIKEYESFTDSIFQDEVNNYIGFVANKHTIYKDEDGNNIDEKEKLSWTELKYDSVLIESIETKFNKHNDMNKQNKVLSLYCSARGISQMNIFLYKKDHENKH
jgi:hypothetical protein